MFSCAFWQPSGKDLWTKALKILTEVIRVTVFIKLQPDRTDFVQSYSKQLLLKTPFCFLSLIYSTSFSTHWLDFILRWLFDLLVGLLICLTLIHLCFWFSNILLSFSTFTFSDFQHSSWFYSCFFIYSFIFVLWRFNIRNIYIKPALTINHFQDSSTSYEDEVTCMIQWVVTYNEIYERVVIGWVKYKRYWHEMWLWDFTEYLRK